MKILNDVLGYKDLKIYQDSDMFNFTLDSILVARFCNLSSKRKKIVDFGTNNAIIPLILSKYTNSQITGVEIQPKAVEIAKENIIFNNLDSQIEIVLDDISEFSKKNYNKYDLVVCNPPFFKIEEKSKFKQKSQEVVNSRHEVLINLEEIVKSAARVLKNGGIFTLVHRADRMGEIISYFNNNKIVPKRIRFVHSKKDRPAKTILIDGVLEGNLGTEILPPLIAHNHDETYTDELLNLFID